MYLELQDIKKSYGSGDTRTLVLKGPTEAAIPGHLS